MSHGSFTAQMVPTSKVVGPSETVTLLGVPFDANSSFLRGASKAPPLIRQALKSDSGNSWTEDGMDLGRAGSFHDAGDLELPQTSIPAFAAIEAGVWRCLGLGHPVICLGGDHSITWPIIKGFHPRWPDLTVLHFDAHPDLYHELEGSQYSHACQFARIMEGRLVRRLVQVGIRTLSGHQREQAKKFGVDIITMRNLRQLDTLKLEGPLYISFDLDVLDPAFAPGVSHHEPGGMSVRQVLDVVQGLRLPIVGADIVEYNPDRDRNMQTAMVSAKVLKEIAAAMMRRGKAPAPDWP